MKRLIDGGSWESSQPEPDCPRQEVRHAPSEAGELLLRLP